MRHLHMARGVVDVTDTKERKTFSLDPEVAEELDEKGLNASAVVNDLLTEYLIGGTSAAIGKELRIKDIERELDEQLKERDRINRRIERLRNERERLEREIEQQQEQREQRLREAAGYVRGKSPDNPAVENWAEKLSMPPKELLRKVDELEAEQ